MGSLAILETKPWWNYLAPDLKKFLTESNILLTKAKLWEHQFHDYSFIVFPAAKAYEGFLKKLFLDMGFITKEDYLGKRFRIGKSLNPNLDKAHQDESWVYDDLQKFCSGKKLPDLLWNTWKMSRNLVFHWFPGEANNLTLAEAETRLGMIIESIDEVFSTCSVKLNR